MDYVEIDAARRMPGLRLVVTRGLPAPWSEAAKAIFHVKGLSYVAAEHRTGEENPSLLAWTGQNSAPVAVFDDGKPRSGWAEILALAERLQPTPALVPEDEGLRALMFGVAHAICGEDGLGWNRRLMTIGQRLEAAGSATDAKPGEAALLAKYLRNYTWGDVDAARARRRIVSIMAHLSALAEQMVAEKREYLVGDRLTAADIYWACFSNLIEPMDGALCPMPQAYRERVKLDDPLVKNALSPFLIEHRDRTVRKHFNVPMQF